MRNRLALILSTLFVFAVFSCNNYTEEEKQYISNIEEERKEIDLGMKGDSNSPFNLKELQNVDPAKKALARAQQCTDCQGQRFAGHAIAKTGAANCSNSIL